MTPEEEAYAEALHRIREAETAGALELDFSRLALNRLPRELGRLTSLQSLDLSGCKQLSGGLSPLAGLTSLQTLQLDNCLSIRRFASLESLLPTLEVLSLSGCKRRLH